MNPSVQQPAPDAELTAWEAYISSTVLAGKPDGFKQLRVLAEDPQVAADIKTLITTYRAMVVATAKDGQRVFVPDDKVNRSVPVSEGGAAPLDLYAMRRANSGQKFGRVGRPKGRKGGTAWVEQGMASRILDAEVNRGKDRDPDTDRLAAEVGKTGMIACEVEV